MSDESNLEVFKNFVFTQWVIAYPSSFGLMCIFYVIYLVKYDIKIIYI